MFFVLKGTIYFLTVTHVCTPSGGLGHVVLKTWLTFDLRGSTLMVACNPVLQAASCLLNATDTESRVSINDTTWLFWH